MSRIATACVALFVIGLAGGPSAPALRAQTPLSLDRILTGSDFRIHRVAFDYAPDGRSGLTIEANPATGATDLWLQDLRTGERSRLLDGALLTTSPGAAPARIASVSWSADGARLLLFTDAQQVWRQATRGNYLVYEPATRAITPISSRAGSQMFAKFSPDGTRVGFVRDNDLFVTDLATGTETRLTTDGSDVIINGTTDWVYEEELGLRDAWRWSPDGQRIAFWRFDQSPIETFYMMDLGDVYSRPVPLRYPKAGTPNSRVRIGVVTLATGQTTWMDTGDDEEAYLARMDFAASPTELTIQRLNRAQNHVDVLLADVTTGATRTLLSETAPAWIEVNEEVRWLHEGRAFLWVSERDGFRHLYLHDRSGAPVRQLTSGQWEIVSVAGVDEAGNWVYFTAANPTPAERQLFRTNLRTGRTQRLSTEPGTHAVSVAPDGSIYLDAYSRNGVPPVYRLHAGDGKLIRVLEENAPVRQNLTAAGISEPESFSFITSDSVRLNGSVIRPPDFVATRQYPVLMYAYGGPGSQAVLDSWQGTRYLWHQMLASRGYIVVTVDNRGTGGRGRDFKNVVYRDLGRWEAHDQIEAARYLARLPYVDADRIGLWGWSYGGYLTALTLMKGGDLFRAGIAVAPVTDWRLYDTIYTERYMRTPQENPEGYAESAPVRHAAGLESDFLLVHGTADDNVHFQNSVQLAAALQAANKQFDFMIYPDQTHSISAGTGPMHLYTLLTEWIEEHL